MFLKSYFLDVPTPLRSRGSHLASCKRLACSCSTSLLRALRLSQTRCSDRIHVTLEQLGAFPNDERLSPPPPPKNLFPFPWSLDFPLLSTKKAKKVDREWVRKKEQDPRSRGVDEDLNMKLQTSSYKYFACRSLFSIFHHFLLSISILHQSVQATCIFSNILV